MKTISCITGITVAVALFISLTGTVSAKEDKGETLFAEMKCSQCHAPQQDQKSGPSLQHIASVYGFGGENALFQYFADAVEPIVSPEHAKSMEKNLVTIRRLTETDQKALAEYIMKFL